jgi:hypothetical protein
MTMTKERKHYLVKRNVKPGTIGWSNFALARHKPGTGYSYFDGRGDELIEFIKSYWKRRKPGIGRKDTKKVCVVPIPLPAKFVGTTATINPKHTYKASYYKRQEQEDPFIKITADSDESGIMLKPVKPDPVKYASVVLYSAAALLENDGERSTDCDWEIVAIIASDVKNEPMHPLAMARNMLKKPGGTYVKYTAKQFAEAVYYWSTKAKVEA